MHNFITLFDKNYLSRGLVLYNSLAKNCDDFFLYILAMDEETENFLNRESVNNRTVISLNQIEAMYPELANIKKERSRAEYCWTLTPYCIQYAIKSYNLDSCTYIDADMYFHSNPKVLFDEAGDNSIIITEHGYTPEYDQTKTSGKYCVQFMFFRNDENGSKALEWWRQSCKEWCYARFEDNKFGDQKYLDDWTSRFAGVYVPSHIGCGVAPWNIQQYEFCKENGKILVSDMVTKEQKELLFVHFHSLKKYKLSGKIIWGLSNYFISENSKEMIFKPYIAELCEMEKKLDSNFLSPVSLYHKKSFLLFFIKNIIKSFFINRQYVLYEESARFSFID
jgi:hypothetical protein